MTTAHVAVAAALAAGSIAILTVIARITRGVLSRPPDHDDYAHIDKAGGSHA